MSIGVQSLREDDLKKLGRIHSVAEARAAVEIGLATFGRVSFDLIYARPHQTIEAWRSELADALSMGSKHLSLYQLTIEPETPFADLYARGKLKIPAAEAAHDLFELTQDMCAAAGLPAYEISNHARPGEESRHNLLYWRYGEYVGVGPGAHGRIITDAAREATSTERAPEAWVALVEAQGHGMAEIERLGASEIADEMLLMGFGSKRGSISRDFARFPIMRRPKHGCGNSRGSSPRRGAGGCGDVAHQAVGAGRFILNELVLRLSQSFEESRRAG